MSNNPMTLEQLVEWARDQRTASTVGTAAHAIVTHAEAILASSNAVESHPYRIAGQPELVTLLDEARATRDALQSRQPVYNVAGAVESTHQIALLLDRLLQEIYRSNPQVSAVFDKLTDHRCPKCERPLAQSPLHDDCVPAGCAQCDDYCFSKFESGVCSMTTEGWKKRALAAEAALREIGISL